MGCAQRFIVAFALTALLAGCATQVAPPPTDNTWNDCLILYDALYDVTEPVRDRQYHAPANLPFLRTSRYLSSYITGGEPVPPRILQQQQALANSHLLIEFFNLSEQQQSQWLASRALTTAGLRRRLSQCQRVFFTDIQNNQKSSAWAEMLQVPDAYNLAYRVLGLYPVVVPFFRRGVVEEQAGYGALKAQLRQAAASYPEQFRAYRWPEMAGDSGARPAAESVAVKGLGLSAQRVMELFARHAPLWLQQITSVADLPGRPVFDEKGQRAVSTADPALFIALTRGRYQNQSTTQLNYVVWYKERPPQSALDLVAGQFDSVIWRVHLDEGGMPLAYDSIHSCGCWYKLWPASGYRVQDSTSGVGDEPVWSGDPISGEEVVAVSTGEHQLAVLDRSDITARIDSTAFAVVPYSALKALTAGERTLSFFDARGFVPGSQRPERFLFWPMGIVNPGATRVLGNQPVAFIGRRHFDDPFLLEEIGLVPAGE